MRDVHRGIAAVTGQCGHRDASKRLTPGDTRILAGPPVMMWVPQLISGCDLSRSRVSKVEKILSPSLSARRRRRCTSYRPTQCSALGIGPTSCRTSSWSSAAEAVTAWPPCLAAARNSATGSQRLAMAARLLSAVQAYQRRDKHRPTMIGLVGSLCKNAIACHPEAYIRFGSKAEIMATHRDRPLVTQSGPFVPCARPRLGHWR